MNVDVGTAIFYVREAGKVYGKMFMLELHTLTIIGNNVVLMAGFNVDA